jgi:cellulose synthase/poly-beta-1,6-N-acetylglucosamine synthase-like glycosyltransferase
MAFPWEAIRSVKLGTGNIVEDMKLGIDLAIAGYPPRLCPDATLSGAAAPDRGSTLKQRTRWEHGHVQTMLTQAPRLLVRGLFTARPSLIALGLELAVPPLSLLMIGWAVLLMFCLVWWQRMDGNSMPIVILLAAASLSGCSLSLSWYKHGRGMLPASTLLLAPLYVLWKVPIYLKMMVAREKKWQRTERIG